MRGQYSLLGCQRYTTNSNI